MPPLAAGAALAIPIGMVVIALLILRFLFRLEDRQERKDRARLHAAEAADAARHPGERPKAR
jgi:hypothetical protein